MAIPRARRNAARFVVSQSGVVQAFGTTTTTSHAASGTVPLVVNMAEIKIGDAVIAITPSAYTAGVSYFGVITANSTLNVYPVTTGTGIAIPSTVTLTIAVEKYQ